MDVKYVVIETEEKATMCSNCGELAELIGQCTNCGESVCNECGLMREGRIMHTPEWCLNTSTPAHKE